MINRRPSLFLFHGQESSLASCEVEIGGLIAPCAPSYFVGSKEAVGEGHLDVWEGILGDIDGKGGDVCGDAGFHEACWYE